MTSLEQTLIKTVKLLETLRVPYMVIGGLANLFWGLSRTTLDVDVTVHIEERQVPAVIREFSKLFQVRVKDPEGFLGETRVLPLEDANGIRVDLVRAVLPYEEQAISRARAEKVEGISVQICAPEDLIVHKIISDRPKDFEDVRGIIERIGSSLDRGYLDPLIRELSQALAKPEIESFYLQCLSDLPG